MSKLVFARKKSAVIPELRPMYKIGKILLILKLCCVGGKSSLLKLHLFNWAMMDKKRMKALQLSAEKNEMLIGVWGIDPSLNMALNYAVSEGLIARTSNGSYQLTEKSEKFIAGSKLLELFDSDTAELKLIAKKITEAMITQTAKRWADEI
ncbi:hypothetical protein QTU67_002194 [Vibrio cholerae]|uniref:hypothetical protein n=1 Tax=Vibrio cholerae TaxID=666 RepID=UPI001DC1ECD3|nr:hypothetical protein [Vibrio cholerae]EGR0413402.1 hypothetical protein [Vibrio cholerae]EGR1279170.1 hypothetical protein [Vibrio cholerae]EHC9835161.1 hypothetical protein [Vibrio cholerae]EIA4706726.1 hypothetical protein [Vibrio cholerae]EIJ0935284.1 hypothetical protein [Vibrio cholerae]